MNDRLSKMRCGVKRHWPMLLIAIVVFIFSGCTRLPIAKDSAKPVGSVKGKDVTHPTGPPTESEHSADKVVVIELGDPITVNGSGASVEGSTVNITAAGTYSISGTLNDGQILVNTKDKDNVELILNGVNIVSSTSAPIYALDVRTMTIVLADGTENYIADGDSYIIENPESNEPNAAIFSKGDLTIKGDGSLTVEANYRNAINSKDKLNITGGNIIVNSVSDGIKGRDNIVVKDGNITVNAKGDGMQSNNDVDPERGFISIEGGITNVAAGEDGIEAETRVVIRGGTITVSSGGGSSSSGHGNAIGESGTRNNSQNGASPVSSKGIKAADVTIEGGTILVDSSDDAIHSNDSITINNGNIVLASEKKGMHSDYIVTIGGADISITKSFEAIEGAAIAVNGGNIRLVASDDGLNIFRTGNARASAKGRPGRDNVNSVDKHLKIEGGYILIDANGDGIDTNDGLVKMTGGTVIVNGPGGDHDGALDFDREFTITGGTLVAVHNRGIAQAPSATSTQHSLALNLSSSQPAGTLVHIEAEDGTEILTFAPIKEYRSVVYSSSELKKGSTYNVYVGGSSTGSVVDGVYSGGSYTPGTRSGGFKISGS